MEVDIIRKNSSQSAKKVVPIEEQHMIKSNWLGKCNQLDF